MVTVWNPADEAQDFIFTLFFTGGHYAVPLHLEPRATRAFNVSEIIQNQIPDAEGNVIPASVHEGSAKISGSLAENQPILVGIDVGVYNVRKATCGNVCETCNGVTEADVIDDPFVVPVSGGKQLTLYGTYNTGGQYALSASWSSSKTSVATVGSGTGLVNGVAPGSATISALTGEEYVGAGYLCLGPNPECPEEEFGGSSGGGVFQFVVSGNPYIFVGTDPNILSANTYFATNGSGGSPQPSGGTCCAASSDLTDDVVVTGTNLPKITFTTVDQSVTSGDRTLTFEYDVPSAGDIAQQMSVTAREFAYATNDTPSNTCSLGYGTNRTYTYTVYTHPDKTAVQSSDELDGTLVTEGFNPSLTCGTITGNGIPMDNSQITLPPVALARR